MVNKMRELKPRPPYEALRPKPPPNPPPPSVTRERAPATEYRPGLLDDLLYGVGLTLDRAQYGGPDGFERFKRKLREYLNNQTGK